MTVNVNEILDFLVARSQAPSTMGHQLDRMRDGVQGGSDPIRERDNVEAAMLRNASMLRCIDEFMAKWEFTPPSRHRDTGYRAIQKVQDKCREAQGRIAIGVLRAYHERSTASEERGLVEIYTYVKSIAPDAVPPSDKGVLDLLQAFRSGQAKKAKSFSAELYADCLLACRAHVVQFNRREAR